MLWWSGSPILYRLEVGRKVRGISTQSGSVTIRKLYNIRQACMSVCVCHAVASQYYLSSLRAGLLGSFGCAALQREAEVQGRNSPVWARTAVIGRVLWFCWSIRMLLFSMLSFTRRWGWIPLCFQVRNSSRQVSHAAACMGVTSACLWHAAHPTIVHWWGCSALWDRIWGDMSCSGSDDFKCGAVWWSREYILERNEQSSLASFLRHFQWGALMISLLSMLQG